MRKAISGIKLQFDRANYAIDYLRDAIVEATSVFRKICDLEKKQNLKWVRNERSKVGCLLYLRISVERYLQWLDFLLIPKSIRVCMNFMRTDDWALQSLCKLSMHHTMPDEYTDILGIISTVSEYWQATHPIHGRCRCVWTLGLKICSFLSNIIHQWWIIAGFRPWSSAWVGQFQFQGKISGRCIYYQALTGWIVLHS